MKRISMTFLAVTVLLLASSSGKIDGNEGLVQWMTFEEALKKSEKEKRPVFIDVYTTWCGYCIQMDRNTFNEPEVAKLLNQKFYAVKFNAQQKEDVVFSGHTFKLMGSGRESCHQLAAALLNNQLSYPTVVFLDEGFNMIQPLPGYRNPREFHMIAQYFGEGHYKSMKWDDWQAKYKSPY